METDDNPNLFLNPFVETYASEKNLLTRNDHFQQIIGNITTSLIQDWQQSTLNNSYHQEKNGNIFQFKLTLSSLLILIMADKQKRKNISEYQDLRQSRGKDLMKQFQNFITQVRKTAAAKAVDFCQNYAERNGEYDEIDEKVCLRDRAVLIERKITQLLPQLTQHSMSYEQCMMQCQKNTISYIVANQSCRKVFEKNFQRATESIQEKLRAHQII